MRVHIHARASLHAAPRAPGNGILLQRKDAPTTTITTSPCPALTCSRALPSSWRRRRVQVSQRASEPDQISQPSPPLSLADTVQPAADALRAWKDVYKRCIVPKSLETDDAKYLVKTMKFLRRNKGELTDDQVETLTAAGMIWEVPSTVESKWWSNFHAAKAFLEAETDQGRIRDFLNHDMAEPHPFQDGSADAVEASRWLGRQRVLYRRQKLTLMQVHLLKRVLPGVRLVRQRGKTRRNKHEAIRKADEAFVSDENQSSH